MNKIKFFLNKFGYSIFLKCFSIGLAFFSTYWLINFVSESNQSKYNYTLSVVSIIMVFFNLGLSTIIQKFYTNDAKNRSEIFWTISLVRIITILLGNLVLFLLSPLLGINILVGFVLFSTISLLYLDQNFKAITDAYGKTWIYILTEVSSKITLLFSLVGILLFIDSKYYFWGYIISALLSILVAISLDYILLRKYIPFRKPSFSIFKKVKTEVFYLTLSSTFLGIYIIIDRIILKQFGVSDNDFNTYSNMYKFLDTANIFNTMIASIFASYSVRKFNQLKLSGFELILKNKLSELGFKLKEINFLKLFYFGGFFIFSIVFASFFLVGTYFGIGIIDPKNIYPNSISLLPYFTLNNLLMGLVAYFLNVTIFIHKEKVNALINFIAMFIGLVFYFVLIPQYGIYGAGITIVIIAIADNLIRIPFVWKSIDNQ